MADGPRDATRDAPSRRGVHFPHDTPPAPGEVIEIADGVLWARLPLPMRLDHVNVYLLDDGDGWTVIDTGIRGKAGRAAWRALEDGPMGGRPITRIVVTHHHPDHIGGAGGLMERHGAPLWTTRTAYLMTRMLQLDHHDAAPESSVRFYVRGGASAERLEAYKNGPQFNFSRMTEPLPIGFRRIREDEVLTMGGRRWRVLMGDGHAAEHATFWSLDDDLVLTGDQVIPGISSNLGVHPTEPEADPVGDWLASCEKLAPHARESHFALPGHKLPFTGLPVRLDQLISNHHNAIERLRGHLTAPHTAAECFVPVFGRELEASAFGLGLIEAVAHLNYLYLRGECSRELCADGAYRYRIA
ncbi:MAG: glyoxylase-like metal-dependent hydrolase (beta-lactamase superfamily II) [Paracoccaceae bacterium]|jgi:glyoxylase-like metal-dependent hydrolase (beta-lactamase superfamily II)